MFLGYLIFIIINQIFKMDIDLFSFRFFQTVPSINYLEKCDEFLNLYYIYNNIKYTGYGITYENDILFYSFIYSACR